MKYIDLPKPHGFLLWRGKQTAIASPTLLDSGEKMLVVSDGEPYGEAILSQPVAVNLSSFEDMESQHCIRPEDRKLHWPNADSFYVYRLKSWQPYEQFDDTGKRVLPRKAINILGDGEAQVVELPEPTSEQQKLLEQVERLPKTLILLDEAVRLEDGKAVYCSGVDCSKLEPVLAATLDGTKSADSLPLYQLALVRIPRLAFKEKKSEVKAMPYKVVMDHPECDDDKPVGVVNSETDKLKGCSENEDMAKEHMAALMANEDKSIKELIAEARKCYDEGMPMPVMHSGPVTFVELEELEEAREIANENYELSYQFSLLSSNILSSKEVKDKSAALLTLATEYGNRVQQIGKKELEESEKAEQGGYLVSGEEGNHLPTRKDGKVDNRLMGAAWAALHGGYRGNKYEGPGKAQAIAKLKKLYESEDMDLPSEKGDAEVPEGEKVGKLIRQSMKDRLKAAWETIKEVMDWADPHEDALDMMSKSIAIKQVNGKSYFIAYSANAFEDRENEIFSTKSLEQYVSEAESKADRGTFNFWHIPGSDFAQKEWQAVEGRFLIEAGPFLDNELGQAALKFFTKYPDGHPEISPEGWGCSVEYRYLPEERKSGVYENILDKF